jgi:hypothetical protein
MAALALATLQHKQWPSCSSVAMVLQCFAAMVELVVALVEVTSGAALPAICFCNSQRCGVTAPCNAALLHLAARRYCNSQRSVAPATLLQLAMQRCCCGTVAACSATLLRRCCSSQRSVAATALLQLAVRRSCDALRARNATLLRRS